MGESSAIERVDVRLQGSVLTVILPARLDAGTVADAWPRVSDALARAPGLSRLIAVAEKVDTADGAGLALIVQMRLAMRQPGRSFELRGLKPNLAESLAMFPDDLFVEPTDANEPRYIVEEIGKAVVRLWRDIVAIVNFIGELAAGIWRGLFAPSRLRWGDVMTTVERAGVNAVPITVLLGFLFGFILAFQSAIPLRQFGAQLFVADLVAISLVRELGPLLTAIIMAGRSGSAFAAEIGTMKVNDELSALDVMGLAPVRFLAVPRVIAAVAVAPLLAVVCNLAGLVGAALVMQMLGFPLVTFVNQVHGAIDFVDLLGGLFKVGVFALLVAAIGCMRGLSTGTGASAVGISTTRAVVAGLVLIIATDGVFAVLYYVLGI